MARVYQEEGSSVGAVDWVSGELDSVEGLSATRSAFVTLSNLRMLRIAFGVLSEAEYAYLLGVCL